LCVAVAVLDFQAWHFDLATTFEQLISSLTGVLRINQRYIQTEMTHFLAHLDAKRTGPVLIEGHALALLVDLGLTGWRAHNAFRPAQEFAKQHEGADNDPQRSKEGSDNCFHGGSLDSCKWNGGIVLQKPTR